MHAACDDQAYIYYDSKSKTSGSDEGLRDETSANYIIYIGKKQPCGPLDSNGIITVKAIFIQYTTMQP